MLYDNYKFIKKIAECRNITRAAEAMFISQPTLTKRLASIEKELGIKLFDRSVVPLKITYAGERFLSECNRMYQIDSHLRNEMEEIAGNIQGHLNLGATFSACTNWLPHILPSFSKKYPQIDISIINQSNTLFIKELKTGELDFAYTTLPDELVDLEYESLSVVPLYFFIPADHLLIKSLKSFDYSENSIENPLLVEANQLSGYPFIKLTKEAGLTSATEHILSLYEISPSRLFYAPDVITAYRLSASGMGIFIGTPFLTRHTLPTVVPVVARLKNQGLFLRNIIAYCKGRTLTESEKVFINISRTQIQQMPISLNLDSITWKKLKTHQAEIPYYWQ